MHEAALLKATGAIVIAVGIGNADSYELRQIASDSAHIFNVQSFDFLSDFQQQILTEACGGRLCGCTLSPRRDPDFQDTVSKIIPEFWGSVFQSSGSKLVFLVFVFSSTLEM